MLLNDFFDGFTRRVVSITGCGGKTSLMWALARGASVRDSHKKILATTTTHTQNPAGASAPFDYFFDEAASRGLVPPCGIGFAGCLKPSGLSVSALPPPVLESIIALFDSVFIEADGSRSRPLKAWARYEPVITASTTVTVGILPLWPLGLAVSDAIIHRLPLFTALSGAKEGGTITLEHYVPVISGRTVDGADVDTALDGFAHSLFGVAKGEKVLFFNQIEDERGMENARRLTAMLPSGFLAGLSAVIAGSVTQNRVALLHPPTH
jgi:probable selenium-dependent hydroxylase accessory protein YqeC